MASPGDLGKDPKYLCNVCKEVLRDARLTECCGQHYCDSCLSTWLSRHEKKTCPHCRKENITHIRNKSLMREINGASVDISHKYLCTICMVDPMKDPLLTECCGQHYCNTCLANWQRRQRTCPHCRTQNFAYILNKSLMREIEELYTKCIHQKEGCEWVGKKQTLSHHLTSDRGCDYAKVECHFKLCRKRIRRRDLEKHMTNYCNYRPCRCEHCDLVVTYSAVNLHYDECPDYPLHCPNKCDPKIMKRRYVDDHCKICPLQPLNCPFKDAGCDGKILRKDMESHVERNVHQHMLLLQQQNRQLGAQNWELRKENRRLHRWNRELNSALENLEARYSKT